MNAFWGDLNLQPIFFLLLGVRPGSPESTLRKVWGLGLGVKGKVEGRLWEARTTRSKPNTRPQEHKRRGGLFGNTAAGRKFVALGMSLLNTVQTPLPRRLLRQVLRPEHYSSMFLFRWINSSL